jgi:hypothetical protein
MVHQRELSEPCGEPPDAGQLFTAQERVLSTLKLYVCALKLLNLVVGARTAAAQRLAQPIERTRERGELLGKFTGRIIRDARFERACSDGTICAARRR